MARFPFLWLNNIPMWGVCVCMCVFHVFFIHSSINEHLGYFHVLVIVNDAAMNTDRYLFKSVFLFPLDKHPEVVSLDQKVVLFLIFWGLCIVLFIVATPVYIPTNTVWGFPVIHILANTCYFLPFLFIYLFIYLWLCWVFISVWGLSLVRQVGATLHRGAWASHYRGLSCCGAQAPGAQAQ